MPAPRPEVIRQLSNECLEALKLSDIPDLTAGEVMSACFTLCKHVINVMVDQTSSQERAHNIDVIQTAIGEMYNLVKPDPRSIN